MVNRAICHIKLKKQSGISYINDKACGVCVCDICLFMGGELDYLVTTPLYCSDNAPLTQILANQNKPHTHTHTRTYSMHAHSHAHASRLA